MRILFVVLAFAVLLGISGTAHAATPWGMNASSCTPGDPAIQNNAYKIVAGSVGFQPDIVGQITLYCPIQSFTPPVGNSATLGVTYLAEAPGFTWRVEARLIRLAKSNGVLSEIVGLSTGVSSITTRRKETTFTHVFDFTNHVYYIRVDLFRGGFSGNTVLYAVDLI